MTLAQKWISGLALLVSLCLVSAEASAVPSISSLSFTSVPADGITRTLTIYGGNFAAGNVVRYRWFNPAGDNYVSASVSSASQLSASFNPGTVTDTIYVKVCSSSTSTACSGELAISVTVTQSTGTLTVTVRRSDTNALLSGATVTLSGGPSSPVPQPTVADGTTTFSNLAVGNYSVMAGLAEFETNSASAIVNANTTTPVSVSLTPSQELTGPPSQSPPPVDPSVAPTLGGKAVVITHGWNSDASTWVKEMAAAVCKKLGWNGSPPWSVKENDSAIVCQVNGWDVWVYDWRDAAEAWLGLEFVGGGLRFPFYAKSNAGTVGERFAFTLNKPNYQHIHFIAHSAGANLIDTATRWLKVWRPTLTIHETFLDAYDDMKELSSYGEKADWADNYVDLRTLGLDSEDGTKLFLTFAYNIDVTPGWKSCEFVDPIDVFICRHGRPYRFYGLSIDQDFMNKDAYMKADPIYSFAGMGYPLSVEKDVLPATLRERFQDRQGCFVSGDSCSPVSVPPAIVEFRASPLYSALEAETNAVYVPSPFPEGGILYDSLHLGWGQVGHSASKQMLAVRDSATAAATIEAPSYLVVNVATTLPINTLRFNWSFATAGEGLLRVFVGGNLVREIDQRYVTPSLPETEKIYIGGVEGPLPPGTYRITFRLDGFGASASGVELTAVELGLLTVVNPTLTVTKTGTGSGAVTSAPAGIDCGADCSESYANGTPVTLTVTPATGSTFAGWSGDCNSSGQVTLDAAKTCTATFTATAVGPLIVSTTSLPTGEQGAAYGYALLAEGGAPPYTWSLGGGRKNKLPQGLTLTSDGILTGTPTKAKTTSFTVQVTDATYALAMKNLSLQIVKGVKFKTKLGKGKVGTPYAATLQATGGISPLTFSLIGGALPPGLTLDPATGQISGIPTAAGAFNFQARVASSGGSSNQRGMRITIK